MTIENTEMTFNDNGDAIPAEILNPQVETSSKEVAQASGEAAPAVENDAVEPVEQEVPPYTPSMKYKYEGKELEIDEFFKPLLTNEEAEKRIRELSEISMAFPKYKEAYQEYQEVVPHYQSLIGELQELGQLRQQNLPEFLGKFNVQPQDVLEAIDPNLIKQHVAKLFALEDLTPEQRAAYNQQQEQLRRAQAAQVENQRLQQQLFERDVEQRSFQLEQMMGTSEAKDFQSKFDSFYGNGAFRNEVIQAGLIAFKLEGRDISPQEAMKKVVDKFGPVLKAQTPQVVGTKTGEKVKVIPNVPTRPASPGKMRPKSLDDIRKLADSMED